MSDTTTFTFKNNVFKIRLVAIAFITSIVIAFNSNAQSTNASIIGTVIDEQGEPVPGATVMVINESTGFQTGTATNKEGKYFFRQLPLGKPYTVKSSFIGFAESVQKGFSLNLGDRLNVDFKLSQSTTELAQVIVSGDQLNNRVDRLGATTAMSSAEITKLPVANRNFNSLSDLSPVSNGTSLGGQRASSTNFLIDGVSARNNLTSGAVGSGPYTISLEAVREFEIVTNEYDVSQGRQGGGAITVVTKAGTNELKGSVFAYNRADYLASKYDIRGNERKQEFLTNQFGFSLGGPIIRNKLHFFVAYDRQIETLPFFIADIKDEGDERNLSIRRDTLEKFLTIAREQYGVSASPQTGEFERKTTANTLFTRLDWQLGKTHTLTLRNNFSNWNNPISVNDNSTINLFEVYSGFGSMENSTLLSLRSSLSSKLTNELKFQYQHAEREYKPNDQLPSVNIPRAIVTVQSAFPTDANPKATRSTSIQIGGQRFTPEKNLERNLQLVNTTYFNTGRINYTFGADLMLTYLDTYISNEQNGRFVYNSLNDFRNNNPSRYAREVPLDGIPDVQQYVLNTGLFAQAQMDIHPHVNAQLGLRWDVTSYLTPADYNPVVEQELGLKTDANPTDWNNIQPRFQLTWDVKGERKNIIKLGGGVFSAYVINYAQVNNIQNSGTKVAAIDVTRPAAGSGQPNLVPRPDFIEYRKNPSAAPGVPAGSKAVSTINLNDPNFEVPTIYKGNISINRFINNWMRIGVNYMASKTVNNYVYLDKNLVDQPYFTIDNEEGRGVFVPANTIGSNGQTDNVQGRKTQEVGRTLYFTNGAKLVNHTFVADADIRFLKTGKINVSYTWNDSKDNTSYNGNVANTSTFRPIKSDPRSLSEMNYSDNQFRHKVVIYGATPSVYGFVLSGRFTGMGGTRYSLTVDGDINGDFVGGPGTDNDLAFVFDPANTNTPETVAKDITTLLNNPKNGSADYMKESLGSIADRNGGVNPFSGVVDVRLSKTFKTFKSQSLELSVDVFNFANLLNKHWGGNYNLGNQNLLVPNGFDQATKRYSYSVNNGVGQTQRNGTPYQIQLGARYAF